GSFHGTGKAQVAPLGDLTADLTIDRLPLRQLGGLTGDKVPLSGIVSGRLTARAPVSKLTTAQAIDGSGKLTAEQVSAYGLTLEKASTSVELKEGFLSFP